METNLSVQQAKAVKQNDEKQDHASTNETNDSAIEKLEYCATSDGSEKEFTATITREEAILIVKRLFEKLDLIDQLDGRNYTDPPPNTPPGIPPTVRPYYYHRIYEMIRCGAITREEVTNLEK